jgi:hypothetical protein
MFTEPFVKVGGYDEKNLEYSAPLIYAIKCGRINRQDTRRINSTYRHFQLSAADAAKGNASPLLQRNHTTRSSHEVCPDAQPVRLFPPTSGTFCLQLLAEISPENLHLPQITISHYTPFLLQDLRFSQRCCRQTVFFWDVPPCH